jgi:phosphotransferase system IIA component
MTSISTPTSLATFQTAHASSSKLQHVSLSEVELSGSKLAVAAVQGDGVWTYDVGSDLLSTLSSGHAWLMISYVLLVQLQTLRPTTSFTVPPSTSFSSRPLSFVPPSAPASGPGSGAGPKGQSFKAKTKTNEKAKANEDDMEVDELDLADQNPSKEPLRVTAVGVAPQGKDQPAVWIWEGEEGAEKKIIKVSSQLLGV